MARAGRVRVPGVSLRWVQYCVHATYIAVPRSGDGTEQKKGRSFWSAMNDGHMLARNAARNGCGWRSIAKRAKLEESPVMRPHTHQHVGCGRHVRRSIVHVPSVPLLFGRHTRRFFHPNDTARVVRKAGNRAIASVSPRRYANAIVVSCAKRVHAQKTWYIPVVQSGTSSMRIRYGNARNVLSLLLHDYPMIGQLRMASTVVAMPRMAALQHSHDLPPAHFCTACVTPTGRVPQRTGRGVCRDPGTHALG